MSRSLRWSSDRYVHWSRVVQGQLEAMGLPRDRGRRVLEAGCGSASRLDFGEAHVVGIDISSAQLAAHTGLDEKVLGDLQTHEFAPGSFDLVVCAWVLEHVPRPELALERMAQSLRPGGLLILAVPNPRSLPGLVTKFTPFRFHVWFYRRVLGRPYAGTEAGPFPTFMAWILAPPKLSAHLSQLGLEVLHVNTHEGAALWKVRERLHLPVAFWLAAEAVVRTLSLGRLSVHQANVSIVARRR